MSHTPSTSAIMDGWTIGALCFIATMVIIIFAILMLDDGITTSYQQQLCLMSFCEASDTSSQLYVYNLNAVIYDDIITITGNMFNPGPTLIKNIQVDLIEVGNNFVVSRAYVRDSGQNENYLETHIGGPFNWQTGYLTKPGSSGSNAFDDKSKGHPVDNLVGLSIGENDKYLDAGNHAEFELEFTIKKTTPGSAKSISESINISDPVTFQLFFESGGDGHASNIHETMVIAG